MKVCHCTLYITNPEACRTCIEYDAVGNGLVPESAHNRNTGKYFDITDKITWEKDLVDQYEKWSDMLDGWKIRKEVEPKNVWTIKIKKITEKYDENGNLVERIVEESN